MRAPCWKISSMAAVFFDEGNAKERNSDGFCLIFAEKGRLSYLKGDLLNNLPLTFSAVLSGAAERQPVSPLHLIIT